MGADEKGKGQRDSGKLCQDYLSIKDNSCACSNPNKVNNHYEDRFKPKRISLEPTGLERVKYIAGRLVL